MSQITCSVCGNVSTVQDPFYDLSLELPKDKHLRKVEQERGQEALTPQNKSSWFGFDNVLNYVGLKSAPLSLQTCLHSFCTSEELLKADQYKCDKCKEKVNDQSLNRCLRPLPLLAR